AQARLLEFAERRERREKQGRFGANDGPSAVARPRKFRLRQEEAKTWYALDGSREVKRLHSDDYRLARLLLRQGISPEGACRILVKRVTGTLSAKRGEDWCWRNVVVPSTHVGAAFR